MKNVTLKDIAQKLKISEATVSLAINNKSIVSAETRERVLECARDMNYRPNPLARGLATNKTMTIGFICPDAENPFIGKLFRWINYNCNQLGYSVVMAISENSLDQEAKIVQNFIDRRFDGIIILPLDVPNNDSEVFSYIKKHHVPMVFCDSYYKGYKNDCIITDYAKGSYLLTRHLLKNNHRKIWYLTTLDQTVPVSRLRIDGYKKAYAEAGIQVDSSWVIGCERGTGEAAYALTRRLLSEREKPDAILTINDYMAYGVKQAIQDFGYSIPGDISLAGYDDVFSALLYETPLTTVRQNVMLLAQGCVNLLMQKIDPDFCAKEEILKKIEPELVVRNTTRNGVEYG